MIRERQGWREVRFQRHAALVCFNAAIQRPLSALSFTALPQHCHLMYTFSSLIHRPASTLCSNVLLPRSNSALCSSGHMHAWLRSDSTQHKGSRATSGAAGPSIVRPHAFCPHTLFTPGFLHTRLCSHPAVFTPRSVHTPFGPHPAGKFRSWVRAAWTPALCCPRSHCMTCRGWRGRRR